MNGYRLPVNDLTYDGRCVDVYNDVKETGLGFLLYKSITELSITNRKRETRGTSWTRSNPDASGS